jgi:2-amino-4-hydroxy-6-hydroxymethyldihydropteridine diphosphokinase
MIYLGIGSNLASKKGGKLVNIKKTIKLLNFYSVKVTKVSSFYETPSYPNKKYPKFINVIVSANYKGSPEALLKILLYIEKKMGRIRIHKNEPRICDIDIIDFKGKIYNSKNLDIPHKLTVSRNFVLLPLKEINPAWIHPINKKDVNNLINKLPLKMRNEITRLK